MRTRTRLSILFILILFSCDSPLDKNYDESTLEEDLTMLKKDLDSTERMILAGTIIRMKFQGEISEDMTFEEILNKGKKWKLEQEKIEAERLLMAEKAALEENERIRRLTDAVLVSCYEKGFTKYNYDEYITYKFVIKNKSDKNIRALKGEIMFTNLFDDEIKSFSFVYDQPIESGGHITWEASTDYNQFRDEDKTLKNKELKDLKVIWKPEKIIFDDGSFIE